MTIRAKLIVCLSLLALAFAGLTLTLHLSLHANRQALGRLMTGRIAPLRDLKVVADKYAVDIVDAAHKARNGNVTMAQSLAHVRDGRAELAAHWRAYAATRPSGHEAILAAIAERRMRAADRHVATLEAILGRGDRPALDRFVTDTLYGTIDPVSAAMSDLIDEQIRQADVQVAWISTVDRGAATPARRSRRPSVPSTFLVSRMRTSWAAWRAPARCSGLAARRGSRRTRSRRRRRHE